MTQRKILSTFNLVAVAFFASTVALAQSPISSAPAETVTLSPRPVYTWEGAQTVGSSDRKLFVVTVDQPDRKQTCHVRSFTADKLVCSRGIGHTRTYLPEQVIALIRPGDGNLRLPMFLGFNAGLGAAIWGTVVLAAVCPPCAVGTGIAAYFFFGAAGVILIADDQPDRLLYRAYDKQLSRKLGSIEGD